MTNNRILGFSLLAFGCVLWLVLSQFFRWSMAIVGVSNPALGGIATVGSLLGAALGAAAAVALYRTPRSQGFFIEVIEELRQVVWPTRQETQDSTVVVVATVALVSILLWGFDIIWIELFNLILFNG